MVFLHDWLNSLESFKCIQILKIVSLFKTAELISPNDKLCFDTDSFYQFVCDKSEWMLIRMRFFLSHLGLYGTLLHFSILMLRKVRKKWYRISKFYNIWHKIYNCFERLNHKSPSGIRSHYLQIRNLNYKPLWYAVK